MFGHSNSVYLINFGILKSFGTVMFGTKHTSDACMGSNQSFPSTAFSRSSKADILSRFMKPVELLSEGPSAIKSTVIGA